MIQKIKELLGISSIEDKNTNTNPNIVEVRIVPKRHEYDYAPNELRYYIEYRTSGNNKWLRLPKVEGMQNPKIVDYCSDSEQQAMFLGKELKSKSYLDTYLSEIPKKIKENKQWYQDYKYPKPTIL